MGKKYIYIYLYIDIRIKDAATHSSYRQSNNQSAFCLAHRNGLINRLNEFNVLIALTLFGNKLKVYVLERESKI